MKKTAVGLLVALFALSAQAEETYTIRERQLDRLVRITEALATKLDQTLRRYNDRRVMPDPRDRSAFEEDMQTIARALSGDQGINRWIQHVKQGGTIPEPTLTSIDVKGFWVVGAEESKDQGAAANAHATECTAVNRFLQESVGAYYDVFTCGGTTNVSQYASIGYYQLASSPTLSIRVKSDVQVRQIAGGSVSGSAEDKSPFPPYQSWWNACKTWINSQKSSYGARFVAASCGEPQNISKYASIGYKQYSSTGTLYLRD